MELQFVICAAKKGWKRILEGLSGNLNGGKEQPFRSGIEKAPGYSKAWTKAPRQDRELSLLQELKDPRASKEGKGMREQ